MATSDSSFQMICAQATLHLVLTAFNMLVMRQDELAAVYISVAATDDSSLQTIYAHATYHADDILWNHRFAQSCVEMDHLQTLCFDKFQLVAPLHGSSDDDSHSNCSRHSSMSNLTTADAPARHAEAAYTARDRLEHVRTPGLYVCTLDLL